MTAAPQLPKPGAALWAGAQPGTATYRFDQDPGFIRWQANGGLDRCSAVLFDVGRLLPGPYQVSWMTRINQQVLRSLFNATLIVLMRGIPVTWYMGGYHGDAIDRMLELYSRRRARQVLREFFRPFMFHHPLLSWAMDGMGGGSTEKDRTVRSHIVHDLMDLDIVSTVKVEGYAFPGRTISHVPSVSTGWLLERYPLPTDYHAPDHEVIVQSSDGLHLCRDWLARGMRVYIPMHDFAAGGALPQWYKHDAAAGA